MAATMRRSKPHYLQVLLAVLLLIVVLGGYAAAMQANAGISRPGSTATPDYRDQVYFAIHVGAVTGAAVIGFGLGKWLNGLGFAYAVLFVCVVAVAMLLAQLASFELACSGHDGVLRYWQCR